MSYEPLLDTFGTPLVYMYTVLTRKYFDTSTVGLDKQILVIALGHVIGEKQLSKATF